MFTVNKIHDSAFGGIGDRYAHYIDRSHFLGRNAMDDALWFSNKAKANLKETEKEYHIEIAVPGFKKNEIQINLTGKRLVIECTKTDLEDKASQQIHKEYGYNQVSRSFILPENVNHERVKSKYQDGILSISLPIVKKQSHSISID